MLIRSSGAGAVLLVLAAAAAALLLSGLGAHGAPSGAAEPTAGSWRGLVGDARPQVAIGQRYLVVLTLPSLAGRVAAAGGRASDGEERRWTRRALTEQKLFISRLAVQGAQIQPEFQYARVLNGFSALLDPRTISMLQRSPEVEGIYPVRAAFPATVAGRVLTRATSAGMRPGVSLPGFDGRGVTIALLDTGVDPAQPYLGGRVLEGVDVVGDSDGGEAAPNPGNAAELERHGTQLAGLLVGAGGPGGIGGVAVGASVLPVRVAGWQRDATGTWAVYSRTDQLLAGLERAVDPNGDGDAHYAARIALVGVAEPYAAFTDGPAARAAAGALNLDTLVIAPAGNDGPAGPGFGSVAGPGGAPSALTVGAADLRDTHERGRLVIRSGLNVLVDRVVPLAGAVAPDRPRSLSLATPLPAGGGTPAEEAASLDLASFFDAEGFSRVAGRAALVPSGDEPARLAAAAAAAGAEAVLLYGASVPPGALGLDERVAVPVVSVGEGVARSLREALADGLEVGVALGPAPPGAGARARTAAPFSSRGLAFDGRVKPELVAAGVALATSEPGANTDGSPRYGTVNGSSASAAVVAGAAALLAHARPGLGARDLKDLLVGSASPLAGESVAAQGAGVLDVGAAAATELAASPATLALGRANRPRWTATRRVSVRNLSSRRLVLRVEVERQGFPAADTEVTARPRRLALRPGQRAAVRVEARVPRPAAGGPAAEGAIVLRPRAGRVVRVPFAVPFGPAREALIGGIELSEPSFEPSETQPAVLTLQAGAVRTVGGSDEVRPVDRLDLVLFTSAGERIGVVARVRNLLPGRYAFALTGHDIGGQRLAPGRYRLSIVAVPTGGGPATRRSVPFEIE